MAGGRSIVRVRQEPRVGCIITQTGDGQGFCPVEALVHMKPEKKRQEKRFIRRLESDFFLGDRKFKGISSDLSEHGLFVRTRNSLTTGSYVNVVIHLADGRAARVSGTVRRAVRTNSQLVKNGMGIELNAFDKHYADLIKEVTGKDISGSPLLRPASEIGPGEPTKGGPSTRDRSGSDQTTREQPGAEPGPEKDDFRIMRCPFCGTRNKVPVEKLSMGPKCGRCREELV